MSDEKRRSEDERVSLAGPDPAEVLKALLKVDPEAEPDDKNEDDSAKDTT